LAQRPPSSTEINRFRLARNHLLDSTGAEPVAICRNICGVQAQIMGAAYLQLWARNHSLNRGEIQDALWNKKTLIKSHLMRQTLHLIPTDEFPLYIAALKSSRVADALRIMDRFRITQGEAEDLTGLIMDALASGPMGRADIGAAVGPKVSRRVREWMGRVWSILRVPMAQGLVCYGPGGGNEVKVVRVDQWVKKQKPVEEHAARVSLLRKYLSAYGPATLQDFAKWAGLSMVLVKALVPELRDELVEVESAGSQCLLLKQDRSAVTRHAALGSVRLLPLFDPFLLAHAAKDHLIARSHYKRVWRNQGWISAVVLVNGEIAGTWTHELRGSRMVVTVEGFKKLRPRVRNGIEQEAASLAGFMQASPEVVFKR
jgi:Winged helix DNA-binding domain